MWLLLTILVAVAVVPAWAGWHTARRPEGVSAGHAFAFAARDAAAAVAGIVALMLLLVGVPLVLLGVVIGVVGGGLSILSAVTGDATMLGPGRAVPLILSGLAAVAMAAAAAGVSALCGGRRLLAQQRAYWHERTSETD